MVKVFLSGYFFHFAGRTKITRSLCFLFVFLIGGGEMIGDECVYGL